MPQSESPRSDPGPFTDLFRERAREEEERLGEDLDFLAEVTEGQDEKRKKELNRQVDQDVERAIRFYSQDQPESCCICSTRFGPPPIRQVVNRTKLGKGKEGIYHFDGSYVSKEEGRITMRVCLSCRNVIEAGMPSEEKGCTLSFRKPDLGRRRFYDRGPAA